MRYYFKERFSLVVSLRPSDLDIYSNLLCLPTYNPIYNVTRLLSVSKPWLVTVTNKISLFFTLFNHILSGDSFKAS